MIASTRLCSASFMALLIMLKLNIESKLNHPFKFLLELQLNFSLFSYLMLGMLDHTTSRDGHGGYCIAPQKRDRVEHHVKVEPLLLDLPRATVEPLSALVPIARHDGSHAEDGLATASGLASSMHAKSEGDGLLNKVHGVRSRGIIEHPSTGEPSVNIEPQSSLELDARQQRSHADDGCERVAGGASIMHNKSEDGSLVCKRCNFETQLNILPKLNHV